jgi:hypothetical protein
MPWGVGKMEYWPPARRAKSLRLEENTGFGGMISIFIWKIRLEIKIRPSSAFHAQHSNFPAFHYSTGYLTVNTHPIFDRIKIKYVFHSQ